MSKQLTVNPTTWMIGEGRQINPDTKEETPVRVLVLKDIETNDLYQFPLTPAVTRELGEALVKASADDSGIVVPQRAPTEAETAGYPELQFYPPGSVLLGILLHLLTLGQLTPELIYNLIPALAFVLPLFTCFAFLRAALAPLGRWPSRHMRHSRRRV